MMGPRWGWALALLLTSLPGCAAPRRRAAVAPAEAPGLLPPPAPGPRADRPRPADPFTVADGRAGLLGRFFPGLAHRGLPARAHEHAHAHEADGTPIGRAGRPVPDDEPAGGPRMAERREGRPGEPLAAASPPPRRASARSRPRSAAPMLPVTLTVRAYPEDRAASAPALARATDVPRPPAPPRPHPAPPPPNPMAGGPSTAPALPDADAHLAGAEVEPPGPAPAPAAPADPAAVPPAVPAAGDEPARDPVAEATTPAATPGEGLLIADLAEPLPAPGPVEETAADPAPPSEPAPAAESAPPAESPAPPPAPAAPAAREAGPVPTPTDALRTDPPPAAPEAGDDPVLAGRPRLPLHRPVQVNAELPPPEYPASYGPPAARRPMYASPPPRAGVATRLIRRLRGLDPATGRPPAPAAGPRTAAR